MSFLEFQLIFLFAMSPQIQKYSSLRVTNDSYIYILTR